MICPKCGSEETDWSFEGFGTDTKQRNECFECEFVWYDDLSER